MKASRILVVLILIAGVGGAGYYLGRHPEILGLDGTDAAESPVRLYGNIEIRDALLAFNGSEHIAEVFVEEGDTVARGDPIATLETDRLDEAVREAEARRDAQAEIVRRLVNGTRAQELRQARVEVRSAEVRVANAQREVERLRETAESGATSEQELDDALALLDVERAAADVQREALALALEGPREEEIAEARARLSEFEAAVKRLSAERSDAELLAPAPGVVQSRILEPGEFATPDRPVVSLALTERKWVRAYVPQPDMGRVALGMPARVTSDTFPEDSFRGTVGFISPTAEFTPKTVQTTDLRTKLVYEVRVHVEDPRNRLRLGQTVTVDVRGGDDASEAGDDAAAETSS